ncbi:MAG: hypothetical protein WA101_02380 [Minisyncoccia bacterium]
MKKFIFFTICIFILLNAKTQNDSLESIGKLKINAGFMLNPQGSISLKDPSGGFKMSIPLFLIFSVGNENLSATPIFSLADNSIGGFIEYSFINSGIYLVGIKSTKTSGSYLGIGFSIPVSNGKASAFIESGSSWEKWDPYFFMGVSIPFTFKVK